jgi:aminotransferase EvaB
LTENRIHQIPFFDLSRKINRHRTLIDAAVARVLASGQFILGNETAKFEERFAAYVGVEHGIGVASGSDAIELALRAAGITAGMKVATSANAGHYATSAIRLIGAEPVFMEVDFSTRNITLGAVEGAIANGVDAVVATHLYGLAIAEIAAIGVTCKENGVVLIEDCAQAHGARLDLKKVGSFGDASAFSFYPTKNLGALGEAGSVLTNDPVIAEKTRSLRTYGWSEKYKVELPGGRNSRLDELQAAILADLLPFLDRDNARRREIANAYLTGISIEGIELPEFLGDDYVAHLFVISSSRRAEFMKKLHSQGISTAIHFPIPDHLQPYSGGNSIGALLVTEKLATEVFSLPCYAELRDEEVAHIIESINAAR